MVNLQRRIERIEGQAKSPGEHIIVGAGEWDLSEAELDAKVAAARAAAGPNDTIVVIRYVKDWRVDLPGADLTK